MMNRFSATLYRMFLMVLFGLSATAARAQFTLSVNSPLTIQTAHYAPASVTITPQSDGWSGTVVLLCSTTAPYVSCIFPNAQQSFAITANTPLTTNVYVNTSEVYKYEGKLKQTRMENIALCSLFAPAMCWLFLGGRRRKKAAGLMLFALALLPLAGLTGCTSMIPPSTPPGSYPVTFTAYSGYYGQTVAMTLVVTP